MRPPVQVGSWEDQPRYTIGQLEDIEINDQTQGDVEQLHVAEQLCLMDRVDCFDSFDFNEQALLDQDVVLEGFFALKETEASLLRFLRSSCSVNPRRPHRAVDLARPTTPQEKQVFGVIVVLPPGHGFVAGITGISMRDCLVPPRCTVIVGMRLPAACGSLPGLSLGCSRKVGTWNSRAEIRRR